MAASSSEAAAGATAASATVSARAQTTAQSVSSLIGLPVELSEEIIHNLDNPSFAAFCRVARSAHAIGQKNMRVRSLLHHVLNEANPDGVRKDFSKGATPSMLLTQIPFSEGYWSKKIWNAEQKRWIQRERERFVCVRRWEAVNAIQAAARSFDFHFLDELLAYLINDKSEDKKNNLEIAIEQLQEILDQIPEKEQDKGKAAAAASVGIDAALSRRSTVIPAGAAVSEEGSGGGAGSSPSVKNNNNKTPEKKGVAKRAQVSEGSADLEKYGAPLQNLLKAYSDYIAKYNKFFAEESNLSRWSDEKWRTLSTLWAAIGDCIRKLPRCVLQYFFKNESWFNNRNYFNTPPPRALDALQYLSGGLLDLDELGGDFGLAIFKGARTRAGGRAATAAARWCGDWPAGVDSQAISLLSELCGPRLKDAINRLQAGLAVEPARDSSAKATCAR